MITAVLLSTTVTAPVRAGDVCSSRLARLEGRDGRRATYVVIRCVPDALH